MTVLHDQVEHDPGNGVFGTCFRCSLATVLDLDPGEIPPFETMGETWVDALDAWLAARGLFFLEVVPFEPRPNQRLGLHLVTGESPRFGGVLHTVVGRDGEILHDPHPSRAGLNGDGSDWHWGFLLPAR